MTRSTVAELLVPDEVWAVIQPLLPARRPHPKGGRPWIEDRAVLGGSSMCCGPGCPGGCCPPVSLVVAARSPAGGGCATGNKPGCGSSCIIGCWTGWATTVRSTGHGPRSTACGSERGVGALTGPNPVDRGKPGSRYHLVIDAGGVPLAVGLSAASTHDSLLLGQLVDAVPAGIGPRGRPGRQAGQAAPTSHGVAAAGVRADLGPS
jgi:hypothetical protein